MAISIVPDIFSNVTLGFLPVRYNENKVNVAVVHVMTKLEKDICQSKHVLP